MSNEKIKVLLLTIKRVPPFLLKKYENTTSVGLTTKDPLSQFATLRRRPFAVLIILFIQQLAEQLDVKGHWCHVGWNVVTYIVNPSIRVPPRV